MEKLTPKSANGRFKFEYEGCTIYEWEQSLDDVNIYIQSPPNVPGHEFLIKISNRHLYVGLKGNDTAFLDEDTGGAVKLDESTWTFIDGEINITLHKMNKAEAWDCALLGRQGSKIDELSKEEVKKKLMLERFQEEHPHFDFSSAEFNGNVPNARDFMGGVKYS